MVSRRLWPWPPSNDTSRTKKLEKMARQEYLSIHLWPAERRVQCRPIFLCSREEMPWISKQNIIFFPFLGEKAEQKTRLGIETEYLVEQKQTK